MNEQYQNGLGENQDPYGNPYSYGGQDYVQNSSYNYTAPYPNADAGGNSGKNYGATAAIVAGLMVLIACIVVIPASVYIVKYSENNKKESTSDYKDDWNSGADKSKDFDDFVNDSDYPDEDADNGKYSEYAQTVADKIDWDDKTWKTEPENCKPEELWDSQHRYYEEFKNCIHEDVNYKIVFEAEEQLDKSKNVCMRVTYYRLEGDIPNLDEINRKLRDTACSYMDNYNDNEAEFDEFFELYGEAYIVSATSYITYHDDSTLSMVVNNKYTSAFLSGIELDCINIDLETGMILDNTQIIDPTEKFVKTVVEHSTMQNGANVFLDDTDTKTLQEMFEDEKHLIVFYTPCGLEVGLNYTYGYNYGWITTTLTDYEPYLKSY